MSAPCAGDVTDSDPRLSTAATVGDPDNTGHDNWPLALPSTSLASQFIPFASLAAPAYRRGSNVAADGPIRYSSIMVSEVSNA